MLIENEFGEIGIDGGFLKDAGIEINEMNSGCICCSLVGDFGKALNDVLEKFNPDRILIEPSGVGKLSDVIRAVQNIDAKDACLNGFTTVVDANKCKVYMKNFGEFFNDQIENASSIILSHTDNVSDEKLAVCTQLLREHNKTAVIVTTPWTELDGARILEAMENKNTIAAELEKLEHDEHEHHHHDHDECEHEHHHHDHDECEHEHHHHDHDECEHEHHHHDHDECEHEHHHHDHDECGHEHHHDHGDDCTCGCHNHEHHHHHADDVFDSIGMETTHKYTDDEIKNILTSLEDMSAYGTVLRSKGIVPASDGGWIHFDYVPGEPDVRRGTPDITGRICVIGAKINKDEIKKLFNI